MPILSATNLKYSIGTRVLLDGVSLSLDAGQRVGLVGRNGQGKTTLLKILAGKLQPDSGTVNLQRGCRAGYLSQDPVLDLSKTLHEEASTGLEELGRLHEQLDALYHEMSEPHAQEPETLERLLKRQDELQHRLEQLGGYAVEHKVDAVLHGLGFTDAQFGVPVSGLSGGQKGRLALAKLLLENPDLLLLDEPTNHLDIAGREWLEEFLAEEFKGAVLIISHDRYVLDRVVERIEEVEAGRLIEYPGNYTAFREIRAMRLLTQQRAYENQQSQWAKEEEFIRRFRAGQRAKEAQGRQSKLERQKELFSIERPAEMASIHIRLPEAPRSGDQVVTLREAEKKFPARGAGASADDGEGGGAGAAYGAGERVLFHDLSLTISRGERWGIIGPNGAGKTTLIKCLLGQSDLTSGFSRLGANVVIGYFAQLPSEQDGDLPVFEYLQRAIRRENPGALMSEQQARDLAGMFLFSGRDQDKLMGSLSGGERSRARLAALLASAKNLIVLDEPTNHLDIPSAERLEAALRRTEDGEGYQGTLLLISHDRALIDATCDHLLVFDGQGNVEVFLGTYSEFHRRQVERQRAAQQASEQKAARAKAAEQNAARADLKNGKGVAKGAPTSSPAAGSKGAVSAAPLPAGRPSGPGAGPTLGAAPKKGPKPPAPKTGLGWMPIERLEADMAKLQAQVKAADEALADPGVYLDAGKCRDALSRRDQLASELERHETEWLYRMEG